jgi:hypothetical protein
MGNTHERKESLLDSRDLISSSTQTTMYPADPDTERGHLNQDVPVRRYS